MSSKMTAIITAVLTIILFVIFAALSAFLEIIALNGASEKQGMTALGISFLCQGGAAIPAAIFAGWISNLMVTKFNLNKILAIVIVAALIVPLAAVISFFAIASSILLAGIR